MLEKLSPKMRAWILVLVGVAFALTLQPLVAWAQQEVMLVGKDSNGNSRDVRVDAVGNLVTVGSSAAPSGAASGTHGACVNTTMNVGTTGTACPAVAMASRASLLIQLVQAGETLTVTEDNSTTATATLGAAVPDGAAFTDNLAGTVSSSCRCTAATCSVRIVECP